MLPIILKTSMLCQSVGWVEDQVESGSSGLAYVIHFEKGVKPLLQSLEVPLWLQCKDILHRLLHCHQ